MAQEEQQHPQTEQQLQNEEAPAPEKVDLKKAFAKEDLANLTSGAKEKMDKTIAGMKGAAHKMTHPFSKEAKEEATTKTVERKNEIGQKQQSIRDTARIQLMEQKAIADGVDPATVRGIVPGSSPALVPGQGAQLVHDENSDSAMQEQTSPGQEAQFKNEENSEPTSGEPTNETQMGERENGTEPSSAEPTDESQISNSEDKLAEETSDSSSRGRSRALNQIPPDSQDYQSG